MRRFVIISIALFTLFSCVQKVDYTSVSVQDPVRHYYPILQGQDLPIAVRLENTGKVPLIIKDIQPSCGCITIDAQENMVVPPGRFIYVDFRYDSRKNVGRVEHTIRFWGNIAPEGMTELTFDVNVVPDAGYHKDYEELYQKEGSRLSRLRDFLHGDSNTDKGYFVGK